MGKAGEKSCWGVRVPLSMDSTLLWYSSGSAMERGGVLFGRSSCIPIRKVKTAKDSTA